MKLFFKKDLIITVFLLVAAILLFLAFKPNNSGAYYEITVDSETVLRESIFKKKETRLNNGVTIVCDGKSVYFKSSDCPDKTCINMGQLSDGGDWAACLPNKTHLKVIRGEEPR